MLRPILLTTALLAATMAPMGPFAFAQNADSAAGESFGKSIMPGSSGVPTAGAGNNITVPMGGGAPTSITAQDLTPSNGAQSNLSNQYGSDAGVRGAAGSSVTQAKTDPSEWGDAYRTLHGSILSNPHQNTFNDPIWNGTDQTLANAFSQNFNGCTQTQGTQAATTVHLPAINHCIQSSSPPNSCTVTHSMSSNIVPATMRCDPNTFTTINKTLYNTATKKVYDAISCTASGTFQHNLSASTTTTTSSMCNVTPTTTSSCAIGHSYSMSGQYCSPGSSLGTTTNYVGMWYWYNFPIGVQVTPLCGQPNSTSQVQLHAWYTYGSYGFCDGVGGLQTFTLPTTPVSYRKLTTMPVNFFYRCHQSMDVYYSSAGCNSSNQCSASFEFREYFPADLIRRQYYSSTTITVYYTQNHSVLVDNGWYDINGGCMTTANQIFAGQKQGSVYCSYDPAGGAYSYNTGSGIINQSMMSSPYPGVSSLCKTATATVTTPGVDGCVALKNTPGCSQTGSSPATNGGTNYTYGCTSTTTTTQTLGNCGGTTCTTNM